LGTEPRDPVTASCVLAVFRLISMSDHPRRPAFAWLVFLLCGVYAGLFAFTVYAVAKYYGFEKAPGWICSRTKSNNGYFVTQVDKKGPAAGRIQVGDRLLAINGDERRAVVGTYQWMFVEGGKTYKVDLDRRGERVSVELRMPLVSGRRLTPINALVGLVFFICGAALALLRPHDPQVRLAGVFLMSVGFITLFQTSQGVLSFFVEWEKGVHFVLVLMSLWTLPLMYHFFSRFPTSRSPGPAWRTIQWVLYAAFVLYIWPASAITFLSFGVSGRATRFWIAHSSLLWTAYDWRSMRTSLPAFCSRWRWPCGTTGGCRIPAAAGGSDGSSQEVRSPSSRKRECYSRASSGG
jgi:hypothetical protein